MKRYQKATLFTFAAFIVVFLTIHQVVNSSWGREQFLGSLTQLITINTPIKNPKISYQQISWGGFSHPLSLSAHQVEIMDNHKGKLSAEKLYMGWSLPKIWQCYFLPSWFSIKNGQLEYENQPIITTDLTIQSHPVNWGIIIDHFRIIPEKLSLIECCPASFKTYLTAINLPVEGSGHINFASDKLLKLHLTLSSKEGCFTFPPYFPISVPLHKLQLEVILNSPQQIKSILTAMTVQTHIRGEAQITLPVSLADFWQQGGNIGLHISGNVTEVPVSSLSTLWPVGLAAKPRKWVTTNLSHGIIDGAIDTEMTLTFAPQAQLSDIAIHDLSGDLYPTGVTVSYLGDLPKVEKTNAHCSYTQQQFIIDKITGVVNGLQLEHGHIIIDDLHKADQSIQITLDLIGNVARTFEIISAKPLYLLQKLGLSLNQPEGLSATRVFLKFPLETGLDLDRIHVEAKAHITNAKASLDDIIANYPLRFDQGDFDLDVDRNHLYLSGSAQVEDAPVTLEWTEYFTNAKGPFIRKLQLQATKPLVIGSSDSPLIKGKLPLQLQYEKNKNNQISFHLKAQLDKVMLSLPWFSYHKNLAEPALFELELQSISENSVFIRKGYLNGKDLNMEITGQWGDKDKKITTSKLKIGEMQGKLSLTQRKKRLKLQGHLNELDVFTFLHASPFSESSPASFTSLDGDIRLKFDRLVFSNTYEIKNTSFIAQLTNGALQTVYLKDKTDEFNFALTPAENGIQTFNLEAANAAEILELFAPGNDLSGGEINFVGSIKKTGAHPLMEGEIDIRNLTVHEAPTLAKILSLSSVEGILRNLSGEGLKFDHGHAHVNWKPGEVLINHAHLTGTALGLTFAGTTSGDQVSFSGEVIPFYSINNVLSKIPVLGKILSGNSEHAVFSTPFVLSGNWKNPDIQVQPLITLAPGGMRKIFHTPTGENQFPGHQNPPVELSAKEPSS